MRLIDADEFLVENHDLCYDWEWGSLTETGEAIVYAPTVDVVPVKRGEWIEREVFNVVDSSVVELKSAKCSVCGIFHTTPYMYSF